MPTLAGEHFVDSLTYYLLARGFPPIKESLASSRIKVKRKDPHKMQAFQLDLIQPSKRLGTIHDLPAFFHVDLNGSVICGKYSNTAWLVRAFFIANRKCGLEGWSVPLDALLNQFGIATGVYISRSTFNRVLNELEKEGDIRRQKFRLGRDRLKTIIHFLTPLFVAAESKKPVFVFKDSPTCAHTDTPGSKRPDLKGTITGKSVLTLKNSFNKEPRARADDIVKAPKAEKTKQKGDFAHWRHPILFTILCVYVGFRKAMSEGPRSLSPDQKYAYDRASYEIENPNDQTSGIEWSKWNNDRTGKDWQQKHKNLREYIARTQIIPYLEDQTTLEPTGKAPEPEPVQKQPELTAEQLQEMKRRLLSIPDTAKDEHETEIEKRVRKRMVGG